MKRTIIFFLAFFAAIAVPVGIFAHLVVNGPEPYILDRGGPSEEWIGERHFDDGSVVRISRHGSAEAATQAARALIGDVPTVMMNRAFDVARYTRSDDDRHGLILPVETLVLQIEAGDAETVETRFAGLDFVTDNPDRSIIWIALTERSAESLAVLGLYVLGMIFLFARGGAWAGERPPTAGITQAPADTLRETLLAIGGLNHPLHVVEEQPGRLVAEWRLADPDWATVMASSGLRRAYRIYLELDETQRIVRATERTYKIAWGGGIRPLSGRIAFFQGISFNALDGGARLGIGFEPGRGLVADDHYPYRFDPSEIRKPLAETVTGMGWTWRPVMTLVRPIGG